MEKILNYIDGELVEPTNKSYFENFDPSTGTVYSLVPNSEEEDINQAVSAAKEAFKTWANSSRQERFNILMKLADCIENHTEELIIAESKDNGKPESLARASRSSK